MSRYSCVGLRLSKPQQASLARNGAARMSGGAVGGGPHKTYLTRVQARRMRGARRPIILRMSPAQHRYNRIHGGGFWEKLRGYRDRVMPYVRRAMPYVKRAARAALKHYEPRIRAKAKDFARDLGKEVSNYVPQEWVDKGVDRVTNYGFERAYGEGIRRRTYNNPYSQRGKRPIR